jgi:hypothetical protein
MNARLLPWIVALPVLLAACGTNPVPVGDSGQTLQSLGKCPSCGTVKPYVYYGADKKGNLNAWGLRGQPGNEGRELHLSTAKSYLVPTSFNIPIYVAARRIFCSSVQYPDAASKMSLGINSSRPTKIFTIIEFSFWDMLGNKKGADRVCKNELGDDWGIVSTPGQYVYTSPIKLPYHPLFVWVPDVGWVPNPEEAPPLMQPSPPAEQ